MSNLYNDPASNNSYGGIINAVREVAERQGQSLPGTYPANYKGVINAILDLGKMGLPGTDEVPPGWIPEYDEDGDIIGGNWEFYPPNGQLWFDGRQGRLFIWLDGAYYQTNGADGLTVVGDDAPTREVIGGQWYNTANNNLYLYDGNTWTIVGGAAGFSTSTLPLATLTTDTFQTTTVLPDTNTVITQENYNTWLYGALQALETEILNIDPVVPLHKGATEPTPAEDFWFDTNNMRLLVNYNGAYVPTAPPITLGDDLNQLSASFTSTNASVQTQIQELNTKHDALAAIPKNTYGITTDKNINIHSPKDVGIYIGDQDHNYSQVAVTGVNGTQVTTTLTDLTIDTSELKTGIDAITADYLTSTDKADLQAVDTNLQSQLDSLSYATPDQLAVLTNQVNTKASNSDVSTRLSVYGGHLQGDISMNGNLITGLPLPATNSGAATKLYVDTLRTDAELTYLKKSDGSIQNIAIENNDADEAGLDFSGTHSYGQRALKFKANVGENYTTFGTNDEFWEYAWEFASDEDFCWKHNGTKVVSIASDGLVASTLKVGQFQPNTADGRNAINTVDVGQTLSTHQSDIHALQVQVASFPTSTTDIYYSDSAPTENLEDGNLWFDSANLRLNVRHGGVWVFPDRVEDTQLKSALLNAVNTSTDYASLKANLISALS